MRSIVLLVCLVLAGCDGIGVTVGVPIGDSPVALERPANLPLSMRQANWIGPQGQGSCVWASLTSLLRWQGKPATAERLKQKYGDGEWAERFAERLTSEGIRFVQITNGDMAFVDWACRTRRGCGAVIMGGRHMIAIVDATPTTIGILDPNDISKINYVQRDEFATELKNSGGWLFAVTYVPSPPMPPPIRNHP